MIMIWIDELLNMTIARHTPPQDRASHRTIQQDIALPLQYPYHKHA
jgi:hypothetical protein